MPKKIYEIEYEFDIKDRLVKEKHSIIKESGRFWEHAIIDLKFKYELESGDTKKALAIANVLRLVKKNAKIRKVRQNIKEVV